jgi:DNA adenine methylase
MIAYMGGKYRMAPWLSMFVPTNITRYGEIFGGAFWLYMNSGIYRNKHLTSVVYNDVNRFMCNLFFCCKDYDQLLLVTKHFVSQDPAVFEKFKDALLTVEASGELRTFPIPDYVLAGQYAYIQTHLFSGLGLNDNAKMVYLLDKYVSKFDTFRKRLAAPKFRVKLDKITDCFNLDFEEAVAILDAEDAFLYFDPPYYALEEDYYTFHSFKVEDHFRLSKVLKGMKGFWALSYYDFPELEQWYPKDEFNWVSKDFTQVGSNHLSKKGKNTEVLIMNYSIDADTGFATLLTKGVKFPKKYLTAVFDATGWSAKDIDQLVKRKDFEDFSWGRGIKCDEV